MTKNQNICPRDIYANNRTLAAGIRTSLSLFAFGVILIKMNVDTFTGFTFLVFGIIQLIYSDIYYIIQVRNLKNANHIFRSTYFDPQIIISILILITLCIVLYIIQK